MTTLTEIAAEIDAQVYELAAFLDLGADYNGHKRLSEEEACEIWEIINED